MRSKETNRITFVLVLLIICTLQAVGQSTEILGRVTDPSGAVIAGARVRAQKDKKILAETATNSAGDYILSVPSEPLTIFVTARGFESSTCEVPSRQSESFTADVQLALPAVRQSITVGADTTKAALERVPGGTAFVGEEAIQHSLVVTLKDVLNFTPGVLVQPRFGADESQFSIRGSGLRSNFHERGVNLFINGSPYQDADGFSDFEALELGSMRKIEVWKGANALRYGGNTSGGAVNFVTYSGENSPPVHLSIERGSYGLFKGLVSSGGVHGQTDYYAALSDTELSGYREHSQQGRQRLYGNLGWRVSDATAVRLDLIFVSSAEQLPGALTQAEFLLNPRQADPTNITNKWGRFQNAVRTGIDVTHRLDDRQELEVNVYGQYRKLWHPIYEILDQDTRTFGGEIRYRYTGSLFGRGDRFVVGIMPQTGTQGDRNWENLLGDPGQLRARFGGRAANWGSYFENQFDIRQGVSLVVGGRGEVAYRRYDDHFLSDGNQSDKRTFSSFSPRFGVTWQALENVQMFGNVSRSYEPPLLLELTSSGAPGFLPLKPQDSWQYELGTRGNIRQVNWDFAVFDLEVANELLNTNLTPFPGAPYTVPSYRNVSQTRHFGVETGVSATLKNGLLRPGDRLAFRSAYTYAHYKFRNDREYVDNFLPGQPRHVLRSELRYDHPTGFWVSPVLDWSPAAYFADSANEIRNDRFAVVNLKTGYDWRLFGFFVEANNLSDKRYSASVQVDAADGRFYEPANGRSVYGGVRWHF